MSQVTESQVNDILSTIVDPDTDADILSTKIVQKVVVEADQLSIDLRFGYPAKSQQSMIESSIKDALQTLGLTLNINSTTKIASHEPQSRLKPHSKIKNIIAVASGKGGVGKSTLAVNLALALAAEGAKVGLLDADIYGPSQPKMLGINEKAQSKDGKTILPFEVHSIQVMSIGFLIEDESPVIWRGPMVTQALQQLLNETEWDALDYLILDLPPGTGDIQLTMAQKIPISGAVIVSTPQDIALSDARKAFKMFDKVSIPVLGVVENMSMYVCPKCGHQEAIFGHGGAEAMAKQYAIDFLGKVPLAISIRESLDAGLPSVVDQAQAEIAAQYQSIARKSTARLAQRPKYYGDAFPGIQITQNKPTH